MVGFHRLIPVGTSVSLTLALQACDGATISASNPHPPPVTQAVTQEAASFAGPDVSSWVSLPDTTIISSDTDPAGSFTPPDGTALPYELSSLCRIGAKNPPAINFELWRPVSNWNRRFQGGSNGGEAGSISYSELTAAPRCKHASTSTDTGQMPSDPTSLSDVHQAIDLGCRATGLV